MGKGWFDDSERHALASHGIRTSYANRTVQRHHLPRRELTRLFNDIDSTAKMIRNMYLYLINIEEGREDISYEEWQQKHQPQLIKLVDKLEHMIDKIPQDWIRDKLRKPLSGVYSLESDIGYDSVRELKDIILKYRNKLLTQGYLDEED